MGNGTALVLFNGTKHDWNLESANSYQMISWEHNFPKIIPAYSTAFVNFEFDRGLFRKVKDTKGEAVYSSGSAKFKFTIKDQQPTGERESIVVDIDGVKTTENPSGDHVQQHLDFNAAGWTPFHIISRGDSDIYITQFPAADWMQRNLDWLGNRPLHALCMPGSHNAGMGIVSQVFAHDVPVIREFMIPLSQCQGGSVQDQLRWGSRYLDIRPFISGGEFWTGHYTGTLGARGQSMASIVDQVNDFTSRNNELIILKISHTMNSDEQVGNNHWREDFNPQEWDRLFELLAKLNHRFTPPADREQDLSRLTLHDFIGDGKPAVLVVADPVSSHFANQGFFIPSQLSIDDNYSDKPEVEAMVTDQLHKMREFMRLSKAGVFLLSWTLTQHPEEIVRTVGNNLTANISGDDRSIEGLAAQANKALFTELLPSVNENAFPNIIYLDYLQGSYLYASMALSANAKVMVR